MTYYGGKELAASFRTVRDNTIQIAEEIPEGKYDFRAAPDTQERRQDAGAHRARIRHSDAHALEQDRRSQEGQFPELMQKFGAEEAKPRTKAEIIALLETEGDEFASFLEGLTESFLAEPVTMPPGAQPATKSRFEMLLSPKEHEMHHRGQLMMMERMLGTRAASDAADAGADGAQAQQAQPSGEPSAFSPKALAFLRALKRNNDRDWFKARKDQYETAAARADDRAHRAAGRRLPDLRAGSGGQPENVAVSHLSRHAVLRGQDPAQDA